MSALNFTVNGTSIATYPVYSISKNNIAAKFIAAMAEHGIELTETETRPESGHYVLLDNSDFRKYHYGTKVEKGNLIIRGSYDTLEKAFEDFTEKLLTGDSVALADGFALDGELKHKEIPYKSRKDLNKILKHAFKDDRTLIGQHLAGGLVPTNTLEDFKKATGKYQSIIDFDMLRLPINDDATISRAICELVDYAAKGGIITTMVHWANPVGAPAGEAAFRGHLGTGETWKEVLTPGTAHNLFWSKELATDARFLKALKDAGVTVVYRLLHEANGGWFWFCVGQANELKLPASCLVDMWKYVYNLYTKVYGLDNLVWIYSPNITNGGDVVDVRYYYPGDEYCDAVGLDWYTGGGYEIDGEGHCYEKLTSYGKPFGMCEFGVGGDIRKDNPEEQKKVFSSRDVLAIVKRMNSEGRRCAFFELYAGRFGAPSCLGYGEDMMNDPIMLSLDDMPAFIEESIKQEN